MVPGTGYILWRWSCQGPRREQSGQSQLLVSYSKMEADVQEFSRQVSTEEGQKLAKRMGTLFVECSAKTNVGVVDIFEDLVTKVRLDHNQCRLGADEQILERPELWSRSPEKDKIIQVAEDENDREGWCGC